MNPAPDPSGDMAARHARMLARYAELSLELAEDVHASALAAEDPDSKARLVVGFQKLGRAMRQSIALEARFVRERAADAAQQAKAAVQRRQDQVRAVVERRIFTELDPADAPAFLADLNERLDEEALYDGFDDEDLDDQIERLSADLGLTGEAAHGYTPRSLRTPRPPAGRSASDLSRAFAEILANTPDEADDDDDEDEDEDDQDGDEDDDAGDDDQPDDPPPPPPAVPPALTFDPPRPPAPEPEPEPDPPPRPPPLPPPPEPPAEPYVPPWERHPNARFHGGSGY